MALTIAIAGMGLIGGSLALAIKRFTPHTVVGIDRDPAVLEAARRTHAVDETGTERLFHADILILALAPTAALQFLREAAPKMKPGALVTDVCGIKRAVVEQGAAICQPFGLHFLGGHPMAGREKNGFSAAIPTLFEGASYILTPLPDTPPNAVETMSTLVKAIGCKRVTVTTSDNHDRMIAFTSQLPHVLAGAYVKSPRCPEHLGYSAGSYRDVSRVATVDETLWSELFLDNADYLMEEIDTLIHHLSLCREAIAAKDTPALQSVLREGRLRKESVTE